MQNILPTIIAGAVQKVGVQWITVGYQKQKTGVCRLVPGCLDHHQRQLMAQAECPAGKFTEPGFNEMC
jgi:hypothetical protein